MASPTITSIARLVPTYYDRLLLDNLYPDLYLWQFGEKRKVPPNSGKTILFNKWTKLTLGNFVTEGTPIGTCAMSASLVSTTLSGFALAVKHSDFLVMTAISDVIAGSVQEVSKSLALKIDSRIRQVISGLGTQITACVVSVAGSAVVGKLKNGDRLKAREVVRSLRTLNVNNAKTFPDGFFGMVLHPYQLWDIQGDTSTGGWIDINKYASNDTVQNLYRGEVGQLYGFRVVRSTNVKAGLAASPASAANSAYMGFAMGPGAYGVVELDEGSARVFVKQLGSSGTADPVNQLATVGAKIYFSAVNLDCTNRLVTISSGKSTAL